MSVSSHVLQKHEQTAEGSRACSYTAIWRVKRTREAERSWRSIEGERLRAAGDFSLRLRSCRSRESSRALLLIQQDRGVRMTVLHCTYNMLVNR